MLHSLIDEYVQTIWETDLDLLFSFSVPVSFSFSLDGVCLSRQILMNTGSPYRSVNTALVSSRLYHPKVAASC